MDKQLTVTDLVNIRTIIDTACSRGTFKGGEMRAVGEIYDKLSAFIDQVQQPPAPAESSGVAPAEASFQGAM